MTSVSCTIAMQSWKRLRTDNYTSMRCMDMYVKNNAASQRFEIGCSGVALNFQLPFIRSVNVFAGIFT
jgi:hypothetical protein